MNKRATIIRLKILITKARRTLRLLEDELQNIINAEEEKQ